MWGQAYIMVAVCSTRFEWTAYELMIQNNLWCMRCQTSYTASCHGGGGVRLNWLIRVTVHQTLTFLQPPVTQKVTCVLKSTSNTIFFFLFLWVQIGEVHAEKLFTKNKWCMIVCICFFLSCIFVMGRLEELRSTN